MQTYYIACKSEGERIQFMENWLSRYKFSYERVPGVVLAKVSDVSEYDNVKRLKRFGYHMSPSEIGCFLAHQECWRRVVNSRQPALILESDVEPKLQVDLDKLLRQLSEEPRLYDLIRLHGIFEHNEVFSRTIAVLDEKFEIRQSLGDPMGAAAYVVCPRAAMVLLQKTASFYVPVDVFLAATWMHRLTFRSVKPYVFQSAEFDSVIGDRTRPMQSTWSRIAIELQRAKDDLRRVAYLPWHYWG